MYKHRKEHQKDHGRTGSADRGTDQRKARQQGFGGFGKSGAYKGNHVAGGVAEGTQGQTVLLGGKNLLKSKDGQDQRGYQTQKRKKGLAQGAPKGGKPFVAGDDGAKIKDRAHLQQGQENSGSKISYKEKDHGKGGTSYGCLAHSTHGKGSAGHHRKHGGKKGGELGKVCAGEKEQSG